MLWEIDEETHAFPIWKSTQQDGDLMEKTTLTMRKVWVTTSQNVEDYWEPIPRLSLFDGFGCLFSCYIKLMWKHMHFYVMKYTMKWEANGKAVCILWKKYQYQFPRLFPYNGICCIFLDNGKLIWKPMHFPYDEVCHRMGV